MNFLSDQDVKSNANARGEMVPVRLPLPPEMGQIPHFVVKVACGEQHTLALAKSGAVFSWGQARHGALGHPFEGRIRER